MTDIVDLTNLREMTGGEKALETELFNVYLQSSNECLAALRANMGTGQEEIWRTQAHAWKGMSLSRGAGELGRLCAEAQMNHLAPPEQKQSMLAAIEAEYQKVKDFLDKV